MTARNGNQNDYISTRIPQWTIEQRGVGVMLNLMLASVAVRNPALLTLFNPLYV